MEPASRHQTLEVLPLLALVGPGVTLSPANLGVNGLVGLSRFYDGVVVVSWPPARRSRRGAETRERDPQPPAEEGSQI